MPSKQVDPANWKRLEDDDGGDAPAVADVPDLTGAEVLAVCDSSIERVLVPEWGGAVYVRTMDGTSRDAWEAECFEDAGDGTTRQFRMDNARARLAAATVCDAKGALLFAMSDVETLGRKSGAALERCFVVARRLNRLTDKDIEESVANFGGGPSEPDTSASQ